MVDVDYSVVLDKNERERMLREGYLPEVIDWHARERFKELVEDFRWKNAILKSNFEPVSFYEFVGDVFEGLEKLMVVTEGVGYQEMDVDELVEYQATRSDVYVVPASFINGFNSSSTCRDVYALVIDIDKIDPGTLKAIIDKDTLGERIPMPSYIVNSGRGVHFYYVFSEPVPHYYHNRKILKNMYRALCGITSKNILAKTDWHAITQPFRLPGSLSRLGQIVTAWQCNDRWDIKNLAHRVGVGVEELDLKRRPLLSQEEYKKAKAERKAKASEEGQPSKTAKKSHRATWRSSLEGKEGFYSSCLQRCYDETKEGSRYLSMCALVVVARKVETISKEQVERDLEKLLEHYNSIGKHMSLREVQKALRMYNAKALETRSQTLEAWFGWKFDREAAKKRATREARGMSRKMTREQSCKIARTVQTVYYPDGDWRNSEGAPTKEKTVKDWKKANPEGKPKDCIEATGLSKNTVYKWWKS